ncbi:MAG: nucleotide sugar dehydrogenase [Actinomycetota bacterium]
MNVGIVGLGKLGFPVALTIESRGHAVSGWDASAAVQENVRRRRFPHREEGLPELLDRTRLELVPVEALVESAEIVFVAVQTPHEPNLEGSTRLPPYRRDFDYSFLIDAVSSVAQAAAAQRKPLTLAVISTVLPGTIEREVKPLLPPSVALAYNPSFTAMGTTVRDFLHPEFVLIGADHPRNGDSSLVDFYGTLHDRPLFETDIKTAELIKVAYNTFIGQKIVFANAMMEICHKVGGDVDDLAAALGLARDRIVSPRYLSGGMGDGGPCHPRDNIALSWLSGEAGLSHDIFADVMQAREDQTQWLADLIAERANGLPIVVLGKAFKPESDLAEGSPALLLASILDERGIPFSHHDGRIDGDGPPIERRPPGLFFVATRHPEYREAKFPPHSVVLDPWGYIPDQERVTVVRIGRR